MASPAWLARTLHEPVATMAIDNPLTVQVSTVSDASDTVRPELAVALLARLNDDPL